VDNNYLLEKGRSLPLMEIFYSIQGEGYHTGEAACFIRIGGCDVGCYWCDVKESWDPERHPLTLSDEIIKQASVFAAHTVVVTGGEPLLYNLDYLCNGLKRKNIRTFLETSGSEPLSGTWDWICLSPKKTSPPLQALLNKTDELKVIITQNEDFGWAEENAALVGKDCRLFLQPEWSKRKERIGPIIEYIGFNPRWKLSVQVHKYIGIP
jgi:7-carboxy-7-deazaguanine synthase